MAKGELIELNHYAPVVNIQTPTPGSDGTIADTNTPNEEENEVNLKLLLLFGEALFELRPQKLPGMSFAWLELISHRMFMPKLLFSFYSHEFLRDVSG